MTDLSPASWLIRKVTGFEGRVRDVVPATYDSFARVTSEKNLPLSLLRDVLARHTQTDRCWFALWDGWPTADAWRRRAPVFHLPHRDFLLFTGSLDDDLMVLAGDHRGPSLWWPEDRAWMVASEVDSDATYITGSRPLLHGLLQTDGLDVTEVGPNDLITVDQ